MPGAAIETRDLSMVYPMGTSDVLALDGLDLDVPAGQFVAIRGRSGSGKTTLLHLLAGLQRPSRGSVRIGDTQVETLTPQQADLFRRRSIGLIFQFFNLIPSLTVEMNVALPLLLEGHKLRNLRAPIDALMDSLGIGHRRNHSPHELSGGELQRVAIARALIVKPRAILADEPTGNLDSRAAHEVFVLLRDRCDEHGVTTILTTHEVEATSYADRVIEMCDGRIIEDSAEAASSGPRLETAQRT